MEHAADDPPQIDAAAAARTAQLPLFSFAPLLAMAAHRDSPAIPAESQSPEGKTVVSHGNQQRREEKRQVIARAAHRDSPAIPAELQALEGKTVVLDGFCVGRTKDTPPRVIVGKEWWDGVSQGTPPSLYNAVMVSPRDARQTPPLWQTHVVMSGKLHVTRDQAEWSKEGIVSLRDASLGVPGSVNRVLQLLLDKGPFLPLTSEVILLLALLLFSLRWKHAPASTNNARGEEHA